MNLSEEVRKLSKELNIKLSEIARRTGQSPANLSKKLTKETLSFDDFERILEVMGVTMECSFTLPGQNKIMKSEADNRAHKQIEILQRELELERMKKDYFQDMDFTFRTAMETFSGSIELIENHSSDRERILKCAARMKVAMGQLMDITEDDPILAEKMKENAREEEKMALPGVRRALVVDDNVINRDIVADLLADSGLEAEKAAGGEEALTLISTMPPGYYDFVLMDLQMPKMDGFRAAGEVRKLEGGQAKTPIIAMTAGVSADDRKKALEAGMNGFTQKPLNLRRLFEILADSRGKI